MGREVPKNSQEPFTKLPDCNPWGLIDKATKSPPTLILPHDWWHSDTFPLTNSGDANCRGERIGLVVNRLFSNVEKRLIAASTNKVGIAGKRFGRKFGASAKNLLLN